MYASAMDEAHIDDSVTDEDSHDDGTFDDNEREAI